MTQRSNWQELRQRRMAEAGAQEAYDMVASLFEDGVTAEEMTEFYPAVSAMAARGALAFGSNTVLRQG
jgi:hypothetical protein